MKSKSSSVSGDEQELQELQNKIESLSQLLGIKSFTEFDEEDFKLINIIQKLKTQKETLDGHLQEKKDELKRLETTILEKNADLEKIQDEIKSFETLKEKETELKLREETLKQNEEELKSKKTKLQDNLNKTRYLFIKSIENLSDQGDSPGKEIKIKLLKDKNDYIESIMNEYGFELIDTEYVVSDLDIVQFITNNTLGSQIETMYKLEIDKLKTDFGELTQEKQKLQNEKHKKNDFSGEIQDLYKRIGDITNNVYSNQLELTNLKRED